MKRMIMYLAEIGVYERKSTIPILSNLLVEAKGSRLTITATDLELSIRTSCEVKVKKEGAGTIPGHLWTAA